VGVAMRNGGPKIALTRRAGSRNFVIRFLNPATGKFEQKSTGTTNKKEAQRILGELRSELSKGRYQRASGTSWDEFRERDETEELAGKAPMTAKKATTVLDAVERVLAPKKLAELTADRISTFIAKLRDGTRTESTLASYLAHLRAALNWAADVGGMLAVAPKIKKPKRAKASRKAKGRAPTDAEFQAILKAIPEVVGADRSPSWRHLIEGLWWSGLRLGEALELTWNRPDRLCVDLSGGRPMFCIPAELEKAHKDRLLPIAPEFAELLLKTPPDQRTGYVFNPKPERDRQERLTIIQVMKLVSRIGKKAGVVVNVQAGTGKKKYASAHDFRRAFGDRWAVRVMPPVLMEMMRHESISTTMQFYVGRSAEATADLVWQAFAKTAPSGKTGNEKSDSLSDSQPKTAENGEVSKGGE
jgi:integrase